VPETDTHDAAIEYLRALLAAWLERAGRSAKLARNLGIRWVPEEPRAGFDPDLCLIEPAPPGDEPLSSSKLWLPGYAPPRLAIEVVSPSHPYKDYVDTPERCAACGVGELWIYDPMLAGPASRGGPHLLQVWERTESGAFERSHAGEGPARSPLLGAWLQPRASRLPAGARLELSDGPEGQGRWLTIVESAREAERQARDAERQARSELEAERERRAELEQRLAELERLLVR
jgi:Uma2 family endonuclease